MISVFNSRCDDKPKTNDMFQLYSSFTAELSLIIYKSLTSRWGWVDTPAPLVITTMEKKLLRSSLLNQLDHPGRLSLGELAQRDVVHNTLLTLGTFQLDGSHLQAFFFFKIRLHKCVIFVFVAEKTSISHLHKEGVLVAVELKQIIIQLCCNAFLVASIKIPEESKLGVAITVERKSWMSCGA